MILGKALFKIGNRNSLKLYYSGHFYTRSYTSEKSSKWVCDRKNMLKCKGRIRLNRDKTCVVLNANHNHPARDASAIGMLIDFTDADLSSMLQKDTFKVPVEEPVRISIIKTENKINKPYVALLYYFTSAESIASLH